MSATSGFKEAPHTDFIRFGIDITDDQSATVADKNDPTKILMFPRVRNNFRYENKPLYLNENKNQRGHASQNLVGFQVIISNLNFDPVTIAQYIDLANAMHIGGQSRQGNDFRLYYYDFALGAEVIGNFIVKSAPVTVLTVTDTREQLRLDGLSFQQV
jgi:hypothetical protein